MVTYKNIIEAVELLDEMTDAQLDKAFEEFGEKQPVLFDFLMSATEEVGEEAEEYAAEYGFIVYLIFKDKPAATEEQLAHAEEFVRTTVDNAEFEYTKNTFENKCQVLCKYCHKQKTVGENKKRLAIKQKKV